jgi:UDPglucose 6-dehydrogenase
MDRDRSAPPNVVIVGTGYVGLTTGAALAHLGANVVCCDVDARKIEMLEAGEIPIFEEGLVELIAPSRAAGRLRFEVGVEGSVADADVVFLCVPTPQDDDGSADLTYVRAAARQISSLLKPGAIVVNKSTVPVGSVGVVGEALGRDDVAVVSNPEFLREGSAVHDCLHPDRVVIGSNDPVAAQKVADLYGALDTRVILTDPTSAELIKYAANGFLAMKISFINSVAALCEQVEADVASVVDGIGSDRRIGDAFLKPGPGWGGSCFPKDSRALVSTAAQHGYDFSLMRGVIDINEQQYERMVDKVVRAATRTGRDVSEVVIGVLGLTFKAGTDDLRESPSLRVISGLLQLGATVRAYDPTASGPLTELQHERLHGIELCQSALDVAVDADAVAVLTEWNEFCMLDVGKMASVMRGDTIVDCRNLLDREEVRAAGLVYDGVGR